MRGSFVVGPAPPELTFGSYAKATRRESMSVGAGMVEGMSPQVLLTFEQRWPRHSGHKEESIRRELGITPARYYVLLHRAAATVAGISADPITARRAREQSRKAA